MTVTSVTVYPHGRDKPYAIYTHLDHVFESVDDSILILRQGATEMKFVHVSYDIVRQLLP